MFYQYPVWSHTICNHYWHLRYARDFDSARIRKQYRRIAFEKKRLQDAGVDVELVRLLCRHMVNLQNRQAANKWWAAYHATKQGDFFLQSQP